MICPNEPASASSSSNEELWKNLLKMLDGDKRVKDLTDEELTEAVINKVWGKCILNSDEDFLISELVDRFEDKCGIKRDEFGEIVK